jgi:hypothetical protein
METKNSVLDGFLETLDELSPEELDRVEKRLASAREKKNGNAPVPAVPPVPRDLFAISFDEYLAMPQSEREAIDILAYKRYANWIEQELNRYKARWILVCGGKVIESGPTLRSYPRSQKLQAVGEQYGLIPFVFLRGPMIEESIWAVLPSPKTLLEDERYLISFEDYLALSDKEGEELKLMAYEKYRDWIYRELAERHARWMLICGGKIIEWSPKLDDYPSHEKMDAIGKQIGYAPWTLLQTL